MFRKTMVFLLAVLMVALLSGCDLFAFDTEELLSPPALQGELGEIAQVISESVDGEYTFKHPSRGNYRSAVIREDINGDGVLEALALYATTEGESQYMNMNVVISHNGDWRSAAHQKIIAGGVDKVEFKDLDNDGMKEILIGWEIYGTSEMQLAVYSIGKNSATQMMLQKYTHFITCDLDENDHNEVMIIKLGSSEKNIAELYSLSGEGTILVSSVLLDNAAKTINEPVVATLSNGKPAVYIDAIKGIGAVTEVLFMEKETLVNPLHNAETGETTATLRAASLLTSDFNSDDILEIPIQEEVPVVAFGDLPEKLYLTNWCSFNGEKLIIQTTVMLNIEDGYYLTVPPRLAGKIAIYKNAEGKLREIYRYSPEEQLVGERLLYIKAVDKKDWDGGKYKTDGMKEIANNGQTAFICNITQAGAEEGITLESVTANFKILE